MRFWSNPKCTDAEAEAVSRRNVALEGLFVFVLVLNIVECPEGTDESKLVRRTS